MRSTWKDGPHGRTTLWWVFLPAIATGAMVIAAAAADSKRDTGTANTTATKMAPNAARAPIAPEHLETYIRYNATDDDAQLILFAKDEEPERAISRIVVRDANQDRVVAQRIARDLGIGQSQVEVRTSQHAVGRIKRAFPAGVYRWTGRFASGRALRGKSRVSYALPDAPAITSPADGATGVPIDGVTISWEPIAGAESILVEVENDVDGGREFLVQIEGSATEIKLPDGFLQSATEYAVELKAVASNGNQAAADTVFTTT